MPVEWYNNLSIFITLFFGLLTGGFVFLGVLELSTFNEVFFIYEGDIPEDKINDGLKIGAGIALFCTIVFSVFASTNTDNLLAEKGVIVTGIIERGHEQITKSVRRGSSSSHTLEITFTTKEGRVISTSKKVSSEIYKKAFINEKIMIRYLPEDPLIFELSIDGGDIKIKKQAPEREVEFKDLKRVLKMRSDSIADYLNTINFGWQVLRDKNKTLYFKPSSGVFLAVTDGHKVLYSGCERKSIAKFLKDANIYDSLPTIFIANDTIFKDETITTAFTNDGYIVRTINGYNKNEHVTEFCIEMEKQSKRK
jgi:hypothetical protein